MKSFPAPRQKPLIAAITGTRTFSRQLTASYRAATIGKNSIAALPESVSAAFSMRDDKSLGTVIRSMPDVKCLPAPVSTMTRTSL